jgi:hypothetical protein
MPDKSNKALTHAKRMMNLYYAVSLRAQRRAAVWREQYKRLQYEKFERGGNNVDSTMLDR